MLHKLCDMLAYRRSKVRCVLARAASPPYRPSASPPPPPATPLAAQPAARPHARLPRSLIPAPTRRPPPPGRGS